jgi:hypothetical protein
MAVVNVSGCKRTDRLKWNNNRQANTITYPAAHHRNHRHHFVRRQQSLVLLNSEIG